MKELSIEEKAKAYDEALDKAKDCFLGAKMWLKSLKEKIGG